MLALHFPTSSAELKASFWVFMRHFAGNFKCRVPIGASRRGLLPFGGRRSWAVTLTCPGKVRAGLSPVTQDLDADLVDPRRPGL